LENEFATIFSLHFDKPNGRISFTMSKHDKLVKRFLSRPVDFTWNELTSLLGGFGYVPAKAGKTGGSRVRFDHESSPPIILHRPHPTPVLKRYQIEQIEEALRKGDLL
jgi:hypothetical protein